MANDDDLVLTPPTPVAAVAPEKAEGLVPLDAAQRTQLEARVDTFLRELVALDANSPEFGKKAEQLMLLGQHEIEQAASHSSRFLERPLKALSGESTVGTDLAQLRRTIEDLDPGRKLGRKKLLGVLPLGNKMRGYFDGYRSAQSHIASILARLGSGKDELLKDNAAVDVERQALWAAMQRLEQMIHIARALDAGLERKAAELDASDPQKARALRESALFSVRQRSTDLLTQMAVSVQGYLALDLVKKNNIELMKGVDRASTTTVAALRTAVTVAQAMTNQKLVLDQVKALNTTTANVIEATAEMLRTQTGEIHKQAASSTVPVETLQHAFEKIYQTMDAIDSFKLEALNNMKSTIRALSDEVAKSKGYIARAEGATRAGGKHEAEPFQLSE
jgi:uncharacterized protein YaaN involved in tellurite resistance